MFSRDEQPSGVGGISRPTNEPLASTEIEAAANEAKKIPDR
jgi:hypothetical protein